MSPNALAADAAITHRDALEGLEAGYRLQA